MSAETSHTRNHEAPGVSDGSVGSDRSDNGALGLDPAAVGYVRSDRSVRFNPAASSTLRILEPV